MSAEFPWTHDKRGGKYRIINAGVMQHEDPAIDNLPVVIYEDTDGRVWVRKVSEFFDGRFTRDT